MSLTSCPGGLTGFKKKGLGWRRIYAVRTPRSDVVVRSCLHAAKRLGSGTVGETRAEASHRRLESILFIALIYHLSNEQQAPS